MKTYISKLASVFMVLALLFVACEDEDTIVITEPAAVFQLDLPGSAIFLNFAIPDNPALGVTWTDDITGSTSYDVEMSLDQEFTSITILGTSSTNSFAMSVSDLNTVIANANPSTINELPIYIRVNGSGTYTNVAEYSITAFPEEDPTITEPMAGEAFVLSFDTEDEVAFMIVWDDLGYSEVGNTEYTVELALSGTDFVEPQLLGNVSTNSFEITQGDLNTILFSNMGLEAETAHDLDLRVTAVSTIEDTSIERVTELVTVSITPYPFFPYLYLVGDATTPGWNNNNNNTAVFRSQDTPNSYYYTGYFTPGGFKMLERLGEWHPQWGDRNNSGTLGVSNPDSSNEAGTFNVSTAGYYTFTATSLEEGEAYTFEPFDASNAPTYTTMGLIGDATPNGWDENNDTNFTQDPNNPHLWYINGVTLTNGGSFLIRANDVWPGNDGAAVWRYTGSEELYGTANLDNSGGDNFPFNGPTGSYDLWFNDLDGSYVIIPN